MGFKKKEYNFLREKIIDFSLGFVSIFAIGFLIQLFFVAIYKITDTLVGTFDPILLLILYGIGTLYFWNKRKYVAFGMLAAVVVLIVLYAIALYAVINIVGPL
jgi:hypothetical protein